MIFNLLNGDITQQELLWYYNANISYASLENGINGFVFNYRDVNNIVINSNLSRYKKRKTILHELAHIELSHLQQDKTLFEFHRAGFEDEADRYIKKLTEEIRKECNINNEKDC